MGGMGDDTTEDQMSTAPGVEPSPALDRAPTADPAPTTDQAPTTESPEATTASNGRAHGWGAPRLVVTAIGISALLGGVVGSAITATFDDDPAGPAGRTIPGSPARLAGDAFDVAGVVAHAGPSVVSITVDGAGGRGASGTGVILTEAGEVLTNAHVVEGGRSFRVTLPGESQARSAELVGADRPADLALLKVHDGRGLPAAELGSSEAVQVGDDVVAIGNALALRGGPTVTRGIVSALDRTLDGGDVVLTGLIQTDASISSGNSGGPLVDAAGRVVGINTAVAGRAAGAAVENIGFAIAIDEARPVIERLRKGQAPKSGGRLGVRVSDPTDGSRGAVVVEVEVGSPASGVGIEVGDLLTHVGGRAVDGAAAFASAIRQSGSGAEIELRIVRDGKELTLRARLVAAGT